MFELDAMQRITLILSLEARIRERERALGIWEDEELDDIAKRDIAECQALIKLLDF